MNTVKRMRMPQKHMEAAKNYYLTTTGLVEDRLVNVAEDTYRPVLNKNYSQI